MNTKFSLRYEKSGVGVSSNNGNEDDYNCEYSLYGLKQAHQ